MTSSPNSSISLPDDSISLSDIDSNAAQDGSEAGDFRDYELGHDDALALDFENTQGIQDYDNDDTFILTRRNGGGSSSSYKSESNVPPDNVLDLQHLYRDQVSPLKFIDDDTMDNYFGNDLASYHFSDLNEVRNKINSDLQAEVEASGLSFVEVAKKRELEAQQRVLAFQAELDRLNKQSEYMEMIHAQQMLGIDGDEISMELLDAMSQSSDFYPSGLAKVDPRQTDIEMKDENLFRMDLTEFSGTPMLHNGDATLGGESAQEAKPMFLPSGPGVIEGEEGHNAKGKGKEKKPSKGKGKARDKGKVKARSRPYGLEWFDVSKLGLPLNDENTPNPLIGSRYVYSGIGMGGLGGYPLASDWSAAMSDEPGGSTYSSIPIASGSGTHSDD